MLVRYLFNYFMEWINKIIDLTNCTYTKILNIFYRLWRIWQNEFYPLYSDIRFYVPINRDDICTLVW